MKCTLYIKANELKRRITKLSAITDKEPVRTYNLNCIAIGLDYPFNYVNKHPLKLMFTATDSRMFADVSYELENNFIYDESKGARVALVEPKTFLKAIDEYGCNGTIKLTIETLVVNTETQSLSRIWINSHEVQTVSGNYPTTHELRMEFLRDLSLNEGGEFCLDIKLIKEALSEYIKEAKKNKIPRFKNESVIMISSGASRLVHIDMTDKRYRDQLKGNYEQLPVGYLLTETGFVRGMYQLQYMQKTADLFTGCKGINSLTTCQRADSGMLSISGRCDCTNLNVYIMPFL